MSADFPPEVAVVPGDRYRAIVEAMPLSVLLCNTSGTVIYVNAAAIASFGSEGKPLVGKPLSEFACDPSAIAKLLVQLAEGGGTLESELQAMRQNGSSFWAIATLQKIDSENILAGFYDISQRHQHEVSRRQTEIQLQEQSLHLETILRDRYVEFQRDRAWIDVQKTASTEGILSVDEQGRVLHYNQRFCDMWSIPNTLLESRREQAILRLLSAQLKLPAVFDEIVDYAYDAPERATTCEISLDDDRTFSCYLAPMLSPEGKFFGRVWFFRDLTESQNIESDLATERRKFAYLLRCFLPEEIAVRLEQANEWQFQQEQWLPPLIATHRQDVAVLSVSLPSVEDWAQQMAPGQFVGLLNRFAGLCDRLVETYRLERIALSPFRYTFAGGLHQSLPDAIESLADMSLALLREVSQVHTREHQALALRIGMDVGSVSAGLFGTKRLTYDCWGEAVAGAYGLDLRGSAGRILVSQAVADRLRATYALEERSVVDEITPSYWLNVG